MWKLHGWMQVKAKAFLELRVRVWARASSGIFHFWHLSSNSIAQLVHFLWHLSAKADCT